MLVAILAHFAVAAVLPAVARRWGRAAFVVGGLLSAATLATLLLFFSEGAFGDADAAVEQTIAWAPSIDLEITLRIDSLSVLMSLLVSGIGALILFYYASYAKSGDRNVGRNSSLLVAFAGAMLGLVLVDDIFSLYLFWELTTVASFLLVGGDGTTRRSRRSATQALLVTIVGGLSMLLGLILLATASGTVRVSEIVADPPPAGPLVSVAVVLVLVGAFTKSAQFPFHFWLPAAMVAPTPVSAYLHAAAMVKAGVYLVARFAPGFSGLPAWWIPVVVLGLWTMILGAVRALRQNDLKTLLAFGTVSQLGFLMVLVGSGGFVSALAGAALILAHGLFKSTLFLVTGIIDKRAGTRDVRHLSGLGRRWPLLAGLAALAVASMAGVPPLLGFVGKEAALEAFLHGGALGPVAGQVVLVGLVVGSALTAAYSLRFLVGAFGTRPEVEPMRPERPGALFVAPVLVPAVAGLVLGLVPSWVEVLAGRYADVYPTEGARYHLALWHGFSVPLLLSAIILIAGYAAYRTSRVLRRFAGRLPTAMQAEPVYLATVGALDRSARWLTGRLQVGSLPAYLGVIVVAMALVPSFGLLAGVEGTTDLRFADSWMQPVLVLLLLSGAVAAVLARRRLTVVLVTGLVGYSIGALFVVEGGVDLALTQFLIESLTLVVFVLVLRRFPSAFGKDRPRPRRVRLTKAAIAAAGGVVVAALAVLVSGSRSGLPETSQEYIARAEPEAGATNVVNAIIVDFRALDTLGEITVLAVAAIGAASLILAAHREPRKPGYDTDDPEDTGEPGADEGDTGGTRVAESRAAGRLTRDDPSGDPGQEGASS
ncbi:hydrogen gas-evolving membrane-bound hydrogenase subunit E [Saccharomonospora xinjiangensis]|uniref:NADH:ubiquinone oxidoreductase subunit 5 (Chain L)/multisubunit Na+/H+ antiporter, MnhA subunit n=1 Tax=Saccharomonospora xinjiangensis XJ-54 TaxID=882086 RepID=I0UXQ6_9PSEU|nr:hydrogen gas-evolving membrane-bound hydrogenase subunit E [Saccharomonospora xinjiangensis]EID52659.1 NADH:ubiquinone oxidoreductase subunit 5 (chain L)/multisubunit Na+/H+ antiporter, MnhA subunit [Saccharomonospora xinjiangensis XJ-54]